MSVEQFDALLANFSEPIDPEQRLAVCLIQVWTHTHTHTHTHPRPDGSAGQTEQLGCFIVH